MRSTAFAVLAVAARALAQEVGNYTSSLDMEIDPNSVDDMTRGVWCRGQYDTCETLCNDNTNTNDCTTSNLKWDCTCASNNSRPGLEYYEQTMPTYICLTLFDQCNTQHIGDSDSQKLCIENIRNKCGKTPPAEASTDDDDESSSTTAEASTSTTASASADATSDDVTTTDTEDIAAPTLMPGNGVAAVAAIGVLAYMI
jgi:hypothetical protein